MAHEISFEDEVVEITPALIARLQLQLQLGDYHKVRDKLEVFDPDPFIFAHAAAAYYTTAAKHYQLQLCANCQGEGKWRDADDYTGDRPLPVPAGMPPLTCPMCLGVGRQPTLRTLNLAATAARSNELRNGKNAADYAQEAKQVGMAISGQGPSTSFEIMVRDNTTRALRLVGPDEYESLLATLEEQAMACATQADIAAYEANALELFIEVNTKIRNYWRRTAREEREEAAAAAAAPVPVAPKHDPARVCNGYEAKGGKRRRCHRDPKEWDEQGKGWCRRHAHKRGLHKAGDDDGS